MKQFLCQYYVKVKEISSSKCYVNNEKKCPLSCKKKNQELIIMWYIIFLKLKTGKDITSLSSLIFFFNVSCLSIRYSQYWVHSQMNYSFSLYFILHFLYNFQIIHLDFFSFSGFENLFNLILGHTNDIELQIVKSVNKRAAKI